MASARKTKPRARRQPAQDAPSIKEPARPRSRARRALVQSGKVLLPIVVVALAFFAFSVLKSTKPSVAQRPVQERIWPVKVVTADVGTYQPHLTLYGRTVAGRRVELRALVSGEVLETGPEMREGAIAKEGAVLLRLDPFEYEGALDEAKAKLAEAKAKVREIDAGIENERDALNHARTQLELAQRDLERAVPLAERGTVSQKTADDRRMAVSEREQGLEQRLNNLEIQQAKAAQQRAVIKQLDWKVRQAKRNLEDTVLEAPFDAYVTSVTAEKGRIVGANDQVATLIDTNWVDVRFTLSDREYGRIVSSDKTLIGRPVEVLWHVGDTPIKYAAHIERVGAEIAAEKGGVEIYARLDDPNTPTPIRPGAFVEVRVPDRAYQKVSRLPPTALYGNERVFVVEDGRLKARNVQLVGAAKDQILVRGEIGKGEKVIITRLSGAKDGLRVEER